MITFEKALNILNKQAPLLGVESVSLLNTLNRVLAENIVSDIDMPPFNKSAVDGYACKLSDIKNNLKIIETIPAGKVPKIKVEKNTCSKIMTGAMIPIGADCVLMVENVKKIDDKIIKYLNDKTAINIAFKAEDIKKNSIVLKKGTVVLPKHVSMLATVGCSKVKVYRQPKIGVISTGNELVEPNKTPGKGQIRNSNSWHICSQIKNLKIDAKYYGIIKDSEKELNNVITTSLKECDIVILSGGVSMGDYDFIPKILQNNGIKLLINKIKIQPGKPTVFGCNKSSFVFGLPGNPVSSFIVFELLVKPFILKMMGNKIIPPNLKARLGVDFNRKKAERLMWVPSKLNENGEIVPVEFHGSAHVGSVCEADFIFKVEIGKFKLEKGTEVDVRQL